MPYKLVIFDFDGTLADSFPLFLEVSDQVADRYHFKRVDRTNIEGLRRLGARQLLRQHEISYWKLPFIVRHARRLLGQQIARIPLFPGIDAALAHLAAGGVTLSVVSSNSRDNVLTVLGPSNAARIRHLECDVSLFGKARRIRKVLRTSEVAPAEALLVGDEIRDAVAARQAGIAFGAVAWGYTRAEALLAEQPKELFGEVAELEAIAAAAAGR